MDARESTQRELDLARLLTLVERRVAARLARALVAVDCTVEEWRVMSLLADGQGHAMSEIADFALLPPPTLTKLVDRMVSAGRVYRRVDATDRRRVLAFLSARGRRAHATVAAAIGEERAEFAMLTGKEEVDLLAALLARMAERLA